MTDTGTGSKLPGLSTGASTGVTEDDDEDDEDEPGGVEESGRIPKNQLWPPPLPTTIPGSPPDSMSYPLAVIAPQIGARSETFVRRHMVDLLPGKTVAVARPSDVQGSSGCQRQST